MVDFLDRLATVDLLHIDDLGAEHRTDWVLEQLYTIINSRYEDERSIVITSNLGTATSSREQIGERIVSRLEEMCGDPSPAAVRPRPPARAARGDALELSARGAASVGPGKQRRRRSLPEPT